MHDVTITGFSPVPTSPVLAGPVLRRVQHNRLVLWLVLRENLPLTLVLHVDDGGPEEQVHHVDLSHDTRRVAVGERACVVLVDVDLLSHGIGSLPEDVPVGYDFLLGDTKTSLAALEPGLCYEGEPRPRFVFRRRLDHVLHGSCRRPHHPSGDAMVRADRWLEERRNNPEGWPTVMLLTGDQIYADDVAGPMLRSIHALISALGLWSETLTGSGVTDSEGLYASEYCYYERTQLLPQKKSTRALRDRFFGGTEKPVFTSVNAGNHLITFAEVVAMYLLVWSDTVWRDLVVTRPELNETQATRYDEELVAINAFVEDLPAVRRLLANVPTAMMFDDHDVTDDWNLTSLWMKSAYEHPFSRRIIGNALIGYLLCQGLGNRPEVFDEALLPQVQDYVNRRDDDSHNRLVDAVLNFHRWDFVLDTEPGVMALNARTRRWRRMRLPSRPSGLMNWEALTEMQNHFIGRRAMVVVATSPMFGVKLIEILQRVFTWFGLPLLVDAENWMAHKGTAYTLLNIFRHNGTPERFTVLSGDVHYSFVYDVTLRRPDSHQRIWQITSSGVKNTFPRRLLDWFDRLNRWLYAPWSPLNWLTKRRQLRVSPRKPVPAGHGERLVNGSGIGYVRFNKDGEPYAIRELRADEPDVDFPEQRLEGGD